MKMKQFAIRYLVLPEALRSRWKAELFEHEFRAELATTRRAGGAEAVRDLLHERAADEYFEYEEAETAFTRSLSLKARSIRVPVPPYPNEREENEWWSYSHSLGEWYLTPKGVDEVRDAIRKEERWRAEKRAQWIAWVSALTGLVGALIGLVAALHAK